MRPDQTTVARLVPPGSRVLDLGCAGGELLESLITERDCRGTGVEIDPDAVLLAIRRGVPLIELDIDHQLSEFADDSYDVVVLSQTLQAVHHPAEVLAEMARIGRRCIVSVPNFGLWKIRLALLTRGRMPTSGGLPHTWYETPNIHLSTLADLEDLLASRDLAVEERILLDEAGRPLRSSRGGNLRAAAAVYAARSPR
ncbi:MAG: methionine biosynthesis protein MetW [Propionibacteriaceae bacterium]